MNDLELWKKVVKDAKIGSPCCSNIFDEMLAELNKYPIAHLFRAIEAYGTHPFVKTEGNEK